jgi:4-amino-4-deoxy-L-arabinose transferase-like glycosyltransferase
MPDTTQAGHRFAWIHRNVARMSSVSCRTLWPTNGLTRFFEFAVGTHRRAAVLLLLASLISFLPGFFQISPIDRDEPRYAEATKEMIRTGDYVDIRFHGKAKNDKPIGIYWLQAVVVKTGEMFGVPHALSTIWLYRMPSLLGAIGAVLGSYWCALAFVNRRGATLAGLMMVASVLLGVEARIATIDGMLLFMVVFAMGALARVYLQARQERASRPSFGLLAIFWTSLALGVLLKGLAILLVVGLTSLTLSIFDRSLRWLFALRPLAGIAWAALLVLPWLIAISLHRGDTFLMSSVGHDTLGKLVMSQEGHGKPPGFYLVLYFVTFFPGSILTAMAARAIIAQRREPAIQFLLAWLVPSWIVFELAVTKLPHYVLPLYPAAAILFAIAIQRDMLSQHIWLKRGAVWWFLTPLIVSILAVIGAIIIGRDPVFSAWPFLAAAIFCGLLAWTSYQDEGAEQALICAMAASVLISVGVGGFIIPSLSSLFPSPTLARVLRESGCAHPVVVSAGYGEPSLRFLAGSFAQLSEADGASAADFLRHGNCRFALVEERQEPDFAARAAAIGLHYDRRASVAAFNLGHVQRVDIAVFQSEGSP